MHWSMGSFIYFSLALLWGSCMVGLVSGGGGRGKMGRDSMGWEDLEFFLLCWPGHGLSLENVI